MTVAPQKTYPSHPPDLLPPGVLGLRHPHGTKMRYLSGCRCANCRRGNAEYEQKLNRDRKLYGPNDLVPSGRVLEHLRHLQKFGIGHKTVAKIARVSKTSLAEIIWYGRKHIRRRSQNRVLAIRPSLETLPRNVNVPAADTIERVNQLTRWGYPKSLITRDALGNTSWGLQIHSLKGKTSTTIVRTAVEIRDFFALIQAMRQAWREKHGTIPKRRYVYWKSGAARSSSPSVRELELRPFSVTYDYNYLWPRALKEASALNHKIRKLYRQRRRQGAAA